MSAPTAGCAECRTLIGGFVLGALEAAEAEQVRRHLDRCPACAAEYERLADIPQLLALAGGDEPVAERPPDTLEEAVLDRFAREHRADRQAKRPAADSRRRLAGLLAPLRRPLPAATAGAFLAAALAAIAIAVMPAGRAPDAWTSGEAYHATLTGAPAAPGARAFARLQTSSEGTRVQMRVAGLNGNPDAVYELWCVRDDGTRVSAGTFRVDARGRAVVDLTAAAVPGEYHRMTIERLAAGHGGGQSVLAGDIHWSDS